MSYTRAVWILDISIYLDFLEEFLHESKEQFPWLKDTAPIAKNWNWSNYQHNNNTQKDELINWIICEELIERYHIYDRHHHRHDTFERVYNHLMTEFDLRRYTSFYIHVPKFYGDAQYLVERHEGALYIQHETDTPPRLDRYRKLRS